MVNYMKIAVIGATGRVGSLVAEEAIRRGHEVTGIVIDPENIKNTSIKVVNKSIFDLNKDDLKDYDVVVSAFGQFNPGLVFQHQTAAMTLINALKELPDVRLLMVGGAASLYTDETKEHRVLESIPEKFRGVPENQFEAFKKLQASSINWTFFSPAATFDPKGVRTGKYKLGTDFVIQNDEGESYISYADYAIAMVDEIENKQFVGRRFTAVSNKNDAPAPVAEAKEFPDVQFEGLSQFRSPSVTELAGKSFYLVFDTGIEGLLIFNSGETVTWARAGEKVRTDRYDCLKVDEDTYLVNLEVAGAKPRTGVSLVLDLEQELVTAVLAYQGTNRIYPDMVTNEVLFGAIKVDGKPMNPMRHGYTSDLVGTRIAWRYGSAPFAISHVYGDANYIRVPLPPESNQSDFAKAMREHPYDERCHYIKIKKNVYLISFLENNMTRRGEIGNNMLVLMDISRLHDCGRSFGLAKDRTPENYMFAAIGTWGVAEEQDTAPSKYRV